MSSYISTIKSYFNKACIYVGLKKEPEVPKTIYELPDISIEILDINGSDKGDNIYRVGNLKFRVLNKFDISKMKGYTMDISGTIVEIVDEVKIDRKQSQRKSTIIDDKDKEKFTTFSTSAIEMLKISMATLLSIFVPQYCPETGTTCTLEDNFTNLTMFNKFVIAWNFITLGYFIRLMYIANKRENYFIKTLDECHEEPYNSLVENMHLYPLVLRKVEEYNYQFKKVTYRTVYLFGCNILFSAILIYNDYYDGFRSVSTLLANVLLVSQKLHSYHYLVRECCKPRQMALSAVFTKPISYNVIDDEYMLPSDFKRYIAKKRNKQLKKLKRSSSFTAPREKKY